MRVFGKGKLVKRGPVVVGLHGPDEADEALRWGAQQAVAGGVDLRIVRAFELRATSDAAGSYLRAHELAHGRALLHLAAAKQRVGLEYPALTIETVAAAGRPSRVLRRFARDASLLVVATRHRSQSMQRLGGSVTNKVTGTVRCPVMSLPSGAAAA